jgi:peptidoglycan/xylan/chitin deacetylase (PgdA/CDA1 family)
VIPPRLSHATRLVAAAVAVALISGTMAFAFLGQHRVAGVQARTMTGPDRAQSDQDMGRVLRKAPPISASSGTGAALPADYALSGNASMAPRMDAFQPSGVGVSVNAAIVVTFSQPMARSSVEKTFHLTPTADGLISWPDDFTLRFDPFQLANAATYRVDVHGHSLRGVGIIGMKSWSFTTAPAPPDVLQPGPKSAKVPILTYHYIRVNPDRFDRLGFALSVTPADFAAQMDWLAHNGYHPITTEMLYGYLSGTRGLPSKPIVLTFDDGYEDFYTTALPILRSHDFTAVAYIVSGFVGRPGYMTAAQVVEADRSGIEIGSHTVDHANLARTSLGGLRYEVTASKQALEKLLGHAVNSFCYPSGKFNQDVINAVAGAGYHDATTTWFGFAHTRGDRYTWTRLRISGGEALGDFATAVTTAS